MTELPMPDRKYYAAMASERDQSSLVRRIESRMKRLLEDFDRKANASIDAFKARYSVSC